MIFEEIIDGNFRGNILLVQGDSVIFEKESGFADLANKVPNTQETRFASASAGKAFVAVAILQLINSGKLKFNSTIGELLQINWHQIDPLITVEQLLTHTSGIPDYFDEYVMTEYEELWVNYPNYKIRHNADILPLFIDKPMMYPRGEKFQYNNTGYVVLAMIIEQLTGMPFDQYLQKNVFDSCGMTSTGYFELDKLPEKCANNYIYNKETNDFRTNIYSVDVKGTGAGGAFITVKDIVKFWSALASYQLLPEDLTKRMLTQQSRCENESKSGSYGYGFWIRGIGTSQEIPFFQGGDPGVSFLSEYHPGKKIISVLVSNYEDDVWKEMKKIREILYN